MSNALVRRASRSSQRLAIPPEIKRRGRLSLLEAAYAYWVILLALPLGLGSWAAIAAIPSAIGIVLTSGFGILFVAWMISLSYWPWEKRKQQTMWNRSRRLAPHAATRKTRLSDIRYTQYSVWSVREGDSLVFRVVRHEPRWLLPGWRSATTKEGYDSRSGSWGDMDIARYETTRPTYEQACEERAKAEETAEELEEKSYQEALARVRIDRLVLVTRRPPATAAELRAQAADEMES